MPSAKVWSINDGWLLVELPREDGGKDIVITSHLGLSLRYGAARITDECERLNNLTNAGYFLQSEAGLSEQDSQEQAMCL